MNMIFYTLNMNAPGRKPYHGYSLIEVTLVITVILGLITVLFLGVSAYRKGSHRAQCIQNISNSQKAVRSFANLRALDPGATVDNLKSLLYGQGRFLPIIPVCPAEGEYTFLENKIPSPGELYLTCSIEAHEPKSFSGW